MEIGNTAGPVRVYVWHVHPRYICLREAVEEPLSRFIYLGDAQNIINVRDDRQTSGRDKVGGCVSRIRSICKDVDCQRISTIIWWGSYGSSGLSRELT